MTWFPSNGSRPCLLLVLGPILSLEGCGNGLALIASAVDDDRRRGNSPTLVSEVTVDAKASPAEISFVLTDIESNPANVEVYYRVSSSLDIEAMVMESLDGLSTSPIGDTHRVRWDYASQLGEGFRSDVEVAVRLRRTTGRFESLTGLGNDVPEILRETDSEFAHAELPDDPDDDGLAGIVRARFVVSDSSADLVSVAVDYAIVDGPDLNFLAATPAGEPLDAVRVAAEGTTLDFFWDVTADLPGIDHEVLLRFTPADLDAKGQVFSTGEGTLTHAFRVDNNSAPTLDVDWELVVPARDRRRGIPITYSIQDDEEDLVDVIFQWTPKGVAFRDLPDSAAKIREILADPSERRRYRIATEQPVDHVGRVDPLDDQEDPEGVRVRLPGVASTNAGLLRSGGLPDRELEGRDLEILRASTLPARLDWSSGPGDRLNGPVGALPYRGGASAIVLDDPGALRLRELDLGRGTVAREIAVVGSVSPSTMAWEEPGESVVIASVNGAGTSMVHRVELESGAVTLLFRAKGPLKNLQGVIRGIASLGREAVLLTVGNKDGKLFRVDFAEERTSAAVLLSGLDRPWGVVLDPILGTNRAYVAENGADGRGVLVVDLETRTAAPLVARGVGFPSPRALAFDPAGPHLLVVTDEPSLPRLELRGVKLNGDTDASEGGDGLSDSQVFQLANGLPGAASIAVGPGALRLLALQNADDLAVGGGIQQVRRILSHDRGTQVFTVDTAFAPEIRPGGAARLWRIRERSKRLAPGGGGTDRFVWDSREFSDTGPALLRATPLDGDVGNITETKASKRLEHTLDRTPRKLVHPGLRDPRAIALADLDGDGDQDLIAANTGDVDRLALFFQTTAGVFEAGNDLIDLNMDGPRDLVAADLDGDKRPDLVTANALSDNLVIFYQTEEGLFDTVVLVNSNLRNPTSVAVADLDADGLLDIAASYESEIGAGPDGRVAIFFQEERGFNFPTILAEEYAVGGPQALAAGDLNGDGFVDLVLASAKIEAGIGVDPWYALFAYFDDPENPGSFARPPVRLQPADDLSLLNQPRALTLADIDADGRLDALVASAPTLEAEQDFLTILAQSGPGGFEDGDFVATPLFHPSLQDPSSVAAADLDSDGDVDLMSANSTLENGVVTILFQDEEGEFGSPEDPNDPQRALVLGSTDDSRGVDLVVDDVNGDGEADVICASDQKVMTFLQLRSGNFGTVSALTGMDNPRSVSAADLDGDGDRDIVTIDVSGIGSDGLKIFHQTKLGAFTEFPPLELPIEGEDEPGLDELRDVLTSDLDRDGDVDIVVTSAAELVVFTQPEPSDALEGRHWIWTILGDEVGVETPVALAAGDMNGDHAIDLVCADQGDLGIDPRLLVLLQSLGNGEDKEGKVCFDFEVVLDPVSNPGDVELADLNGDGRLDVVCSDAGANLLVFLQRQGAGRLEFDDPEILEHPGTNSLAIADLNGDGILDLVSASNDSTSHSLAVFFQDEEGYSVEPDLVLFDPNLWPHSVVVSDIDADGFVDLACPNGGDEEGIAILDQTAPGVFALPPRFVGRKGLAPISLLAADLTGDGDMDLVGPNGAIGKSIHVLLSGQ